VTQGPVSRRLGLADLEFHTAGMHIAAHASGVDAGVVLERQAELMALLHHHAPDVSDPRSSESPGRNGDQAGPDAFRADQAEATISSTE